MYLYNSATHKKEEFVPYDPKLVKMYTCGPTVYHFAHIGNLRSYIMEDVLEKYLRYAGYPVKRVMNITDVGHLTSDADEGEDKMLKGARREHKTVMEIAQFYTDAFFEDCRKLNIKKPDVVQPATGCIDEYIKIITKLLDTGYAYIEGGNVYFDTSKLENTTFSTSTKRKTSPSAFARASRRIRTSATRTTSCSGSQNPSLRIRRSSGILRGASAIRAGTSNAPAFRSNIWANTSTSTAAASTTHSRTIRTRSRSLRAISATTGAIIGCTLCI